jgi:hypothetical protein
MHVLTLVYIILVIVLVARLFGQRAWHWTIAVAVGVMVSFEHLAAYYRYTGMIWNLLSGTLAVGGLHLLQTAFNGTRRRAWYLSGAVTLCFLSVLCKEDFVLAVLVYCLAYAVWPSLDERADRAAARIAFLALVAVTGLYGGYIVFVQRTGYLTTGHGTFASDFSPDSLIATAFAYLTVTRGAVAVTVALAALVVVARFLDRAIWRRMLLLSVMVLALVAPYACLPDHFQAEYGFNWFMFQAAAVPLLAPASSVWASRAGLRRGLAATAILAAGGLVIWTHSNRVNVSRWFAGNAAANASMVSFLLEHKALLEASAVVGVIEPPLMNPWFANDGQFLSGRYGLTPAWIVFTRKGSEYEKAVSTFRFNFENRTDDWTVFRLGRIETRDIRELDRWSGIPLLEFADDGTGSLRESASLARKLVDGGSEPTR